MPWVITRLCRDCVDLACVEACPVDCIFEYTGPDREAFPNQLYIDPEECIDCSLCEPECPWEAIFEAPDVPACFRDDIARNAAVTRAEEHFRVPQLTARPPRPTPEEVAANLEKWEYRE